MLGPIAMNMDIPANNTTGENKQVMTDDEHVLIHSEEQPMKQLESSTICIFNPPFLCTNGQTEVQKLKMRGQIISVLVTMCIYVGSFVCCLKGSRYKKVHIFCTLKNM